MCLGVVTAMLNCVSIHFPKQATASAKSEPAKPSESSTDNSAESKKEVPEPSETPAANPNQPYYHTIREGDTLVGLSLKYDVSVRVRYPPTLA